MASSHSKVITTESPCRKTLKISVNDVDEVLERQQGVLQKRTKRGVVWDKWYEKWRSRVMISRTPYHLGYFSSYEDACAAIDDFRAERGL